MDAATAPLVPASPAKCLRYREAAPAPALREAIACYWQIDGNVAGRAARNHRVLPDACVDLLFDLQEWRGRGQLDAARLVGTMTRALCFPIAGDVDLVGVRFRPGGATLLCADPLQQLTDGSALADCWLGRGTRSLVSQLAELDDFDARVRLLERFLLLEVATHAPDAAVLAATKRIEAGDGEPASIARVAREIGLGERQLERRFRAATGLAPVVYRRVLRFRRLLEAWGRADVGSIADAALFAGYFDQAHMTREFGRLAGIAPLAWRAEQAHVGIVQEARLTFR